MDSRIVTLVLVLLGAAVIGRSVLWGLRIRRLAAGPIQRDWTLLLGLMVFFIVGYLGFAYVLARGISVPLELISGVVFLLGAHFVLIVTKLANATLLTLKEKEKETEAYLAELVKRNEELEEEIGGRYRAEDGRKDSQRFLSTVFQSINDPFCIFDRSFRIVQANESYARLKNRSLADMLGRTCYVLEGGTAPCEECLVEKTIASKDPCAKKKLVRGPDGSEAWYELYSYPVMDERGEVTHVIEYTRDVTDQTRLEQESKQALERFAHLSRTDQLTGLLNRRGLAERLEHEIERSRRYGSKLALILGDVDYFKQINDTFGHASGDRALKGVAVIIEGLLRKSDLAGRYGGDEFMIVLPETGPAGARSFAERIREKVAASRLSAEDGRPMEFTMSMGVAGYLPEMQEVDDLIGPVDKALYASKAQGRNRVTVHSSPD